MSSDVVSNSVQLGVTVIILCCIILVSVDLCVISLSIYNGYEKRIYTGSSIRTSIETLEQYDTYAPVCFRVLTENENLIKVLNIHSDNNTHSTSDIDYLKQHAEKKYSTNVSRDNKGFYYIDMVEVD